MGTFFSGLSMIFPRLIDHSVEIGVLICLIFAVKLMASKKLPPWWHYSLWVMLLVRMLIPVEFENRLNVFNFVPDLTTSQISELIADNPPESEFLTHQLAPKHLRNGVDVQFIVKKSIPVLWLTGAMILGVCILFESISFWLSVRRKPRVTDETILALLSECKRRMNVERSIDIVVTEHVRCPALFGYFRPRLLLPEGIFEKLDHQELAYAFMHELGHLKRHDIGVSWLIAGLQVVHWFNPLVWLAFYQLRVDQESACDAAVLSRIKHIQSAEYAKAIVGFLEKFCQNCQLPSLAGVLENRTQMKKRISKIVHYRRASHRMTFAALGMLLFAGVVLFSLMGAQSEKQAPPVPEPIVTQAPAEVPVMIAEDGGTRGNRDERVKILPDGAGEPLQLSERDGGSDNFQAVMPQAPRASGQFQTRIQPQAVPNDDTQSAGHTTSTKGVTYLSLADAYDYKPAGIIESRQVVNRKDDVSGKFPLRLEASIDSIEGRRPEATEGHAAMVSASVEPKGGKAEGGQVPGASRIYVTDVKIKAEAVISLPGIGIPADLDGPAPDTGTGINDVVAGRNRGEDETNQPGGFYAEQDEFVMATGTESQNRIKNISLPGTGQRNRRMEAYPLADVDTPPRVIKVYPLRYPYQAKRDDISGSITLQFIVTKEGNAIGTTVVESEPQGIFDETALQAIGQYRFKPGTKDGKAVDVKVSLPIKFTLT